MNSPDEAGIRFRSGADRFLLVEFGEVLDLERNVRAIGLAQALRQGNVTGVIEAVPSFASTLVHFDPSRLTSAALMDECRQILQRLKSAADLEIPSRLIEIPVHYDDRWTRACAEEYGKKFKPIEPNAEFVARLNGLKDIAALALHHSAPEWWVGAVGFMAGLPTLMPLDPGFSLSAPKYDPPRLWTPAGTIGLGGGFTAIYPTVTPDGYQMLGRTPVPIFDPQRRLRPFADSIFLFKVGDRVRFVPIDEEKFTAIEAQVACGSYEFNISAAAPFSLHRSRELRRGGGAPSECQVERKA